MTVLNDILEEEALAEINRILDASDAKAAALIQEAETEASTRLTVRRKRIAAESRAAKRRAEGAADLVVLTARIQAKGQIMARVREKALDAIEKLADQPGYGRILTALADEAIRAVDAAEAVIVNPEDTAILSGWAMQKRIDIRTDPALRLGVRVVSSSKRSVENSLPERLDRSWDTLSSRVAKILWE